MTPTTGAQPRPPVTIDHVAAARLFDRPADAVRTAQTDDVADLPAQHHACHPAGQPNRMLELLGIVRIGDDRDRYFADAEGVHHVELAELEANARRTSVSTKRIVKVEMPAVSSRAVDARRMHRVRSHRRPG